MLAETPRRGRSDLSNHLPRMPSGVVGGSVAWGHGAEVVGVTDFAALFFTHINVPACANPALITAHTPACGPQDQSLPCNACLCKQLCLRRFEAWKGLFNRRACGFVWARRITQISCAFCRIRTRTQGTCSGTVRSPGLTAAT